MRASIWLEDGVQQVVLTPENELERTSLRAIQDKQHSVQAFWGVFYNCQGGWMRQGNDPMSEIAPRGRGVSEEASLIFRLADSQIMLRDAATRRQAAAVAIVKDLMSRSVIGKSFEDVIKERPDWQGFITKQIADILEGHVQ